MFEVDSYLVCLSNKPNVRLIGDPPECIYPMVFFMVLLLRIWGEMEPVFGSVNITFSPLSWVVATVPILGLNCWLSGHHYTLLNTLGYHTFMSLAIPL